MTNACCAHFNRAIWLKKRYALSFSCASFTACVYYMALMLWPSPHHAPSHSMLEQSILSEVPEPQLRRSRAIVRSPQI